MSVPKKLILVILDGFGWGSKTPCNAISNARMPFLESLLKQRPFTELQTHGLAVGLPEGVMGNSEVGHMTMGLGQVIYQDLTRIDQAILNGSFFINPVLKTALTKGQAARRLHLLGICSEGGVHGHLNHLVTLVDWALEVGVSNVYVHAILDGRDAGPKSAASILQDLLKRPSFTSGQAQIATMGGRFFFMDRDNRLERTQLALDVLRGAAVSEGTDPLTVIQRNYAQNVTDEFIQPVLLQKAGVIGPEDAVIFCNYRIDRARQLLNALSGHVLPENLFSLTQLDDLIGRQQVAFMPQQKPVPFGQMLADQGLRQLRVAETEKYAHVTTFFNGGIKQPFAKEARILLPSDRQVKTYDQAPHMQARKIVEAVGHQILCQGFDFALLNLANADMVGHTGNYAAAVDAMEHLDACLSFLVPLAHQHGIEVVITADHGNAEKMCNEDGSMNTQHTLNPVPFIWASCEAKSRHCLQTGSLAHVQATLCTIMGLPVFEGVLPSLFRA